MSRVPIPFLSYKPWALDKRSDWTPDDIIGDGPPLYDVHEVSAYALRGRLTMYARGRMRTKDGAAGPSRGVTLDLDAEQPEWLSAVIEDARARLS